MQKNCQLIQSAINFSEGRRHDVIHAIVKACDFGPDSVVADWSADCDHNRMVVTVLGTPDGIRAAVSAATEVAVRHIDLRIHTGIHPRIGAIDVIPITPIRNVSMEECIDLSKHIAADLANRHLIPVYFYEMSAQTGHTFVLPEIRKGGFEALIGHDLSGAQSPDLGPHFLHPSAGVTVIGARCPLIAYNVDLESADNIIARKIARSIRSERDHNQTLEGVRALGLFLETRGCAQVSMNLTQTHTTNLVKVYNYVREQSMRCGIGIRQSEIIGLVPQETLESRTPEEIQWKNFRPSQILEYWLTKL